MKHWTHYALRSLEHGLPWAVLGVLILYTYAELFYVPYIGFRFSSGSGVVQQLFVGKPLPSTDLQAGDQLKQVGTVTWAQYASDLRQPLFMEAKTDQFLPLVVERDHQQRTIQWLVPRPTFLEVLDRLVNVWWLSYIFWLAGAATVLFLRPKDTRWRLLSAFYFLTAIWLVAGNLSHWGLWDSALVLRVAVWLSAPVCLHLHLLFPQPLWKPPRAISWSSYGLSVVLALLQWFQLLSARAYLYSFLLAVAGSLLLLTLQLFRHSQQRRQVRFLFAMIGIAFSAAMIVDIIQIFQPNIWFGAAGLLALPLIPAAYFYAAFQRQLGKQELRANKVITLYIYIIAVGTLMMLAIALILHGTSFSAWAIFVGVAASLFTALLTALGFPAFVRFIEARLLGISLASSELVETYLASIITSLSYPSLARLLRDNVLPSLLVRQSALLQLNGEQIVHTIYLQNIAEELLPHDQAVHLLLTQAEKYRVPNEEALSEPYAWVRLVVPLWMNGRCIGLWLFGKRDPDDFYAQSELATFRVLAHQTAIALTNIHQAEQLQAIYQANIDRHELERTGLAHVLHDEVLQQLALLALHVEEIKTSPHFDGAYEELTRRIRQLITGLRPAMMNYGLHAALEELAEDLKERAGDAIDVQIQLPDTFTRYPDRVEQYIFRIVQQACENALRHARPTLIQIGGQLAPDSIVLRITDDGIGFPAGKQFDLTSLLMNKHFGLVGMYERTTLIHATLRISSTAGHGAQVTVAWPADTDMAKQSPQFSVAERAPQRNHSATALDLR